MNDEHPLILRIVRYGLPLVVALFYLTASLTFDYTPDSAYATFHAARELVQYGEVIQNQSAAVSPNPLWVFFVALGVVLGIDVVLTAKVFSLFFASLSVLFTYLVANELLKERLLGFCTALLMAMQYSLLQSAPSGTAHAIAMTLSLAAMFFLLRNEYLLATLFTGLCTLVFWEGIALFFILIIDIWLNSTSKRRGIKVIGSAVLVYVAVLLPWLLYSIAVRSSFITLLVPVGEFPEVSWKETVSMAVIGVLTVAGVALLTRRLEERAAFMRNQSAALAWGLLACCIGLYGGSDLWMLAIPFGVAFAFQGLKQSLIRWNKPGAVYSSAFLLTALLLALSQATFTGVARTAMVEGIEASQQLIPISYWIRSHIPDDATVCAVYRPEILSYYAERDVTCADRSKTDRKREERDYVVDNAATMDGFDLVYTTGIAGPTHVYGVWRRR